MFRVPENYRLKNHPTHPSTEADGNNGAFILPVDGPRGRYWMLCLASDGMGWEHVSVSLWKVPGVEPIRRTPTWQEMCLVKSAFWGPEDVVVQFHPPESEYQNRHPHVLHLWRPVGITLPRPPSFLV